MSILTGIEQHSPTWTTVAAYLRAEIERARDELEGPESEPGAWDRARGRIELARRLLAATTPPPVIPALSTPYT